MSVHEATKCDRCGKPVTAWQAGRTYVRWERAPRGAFSPLESGRFDCCPPCAAVVLSAFDRIMGGKDA